MRQRNFLRLVNIKNENIFNQARRNGLESYQPFSGKGRYRTECGRNCTGSTLWADAAGLGIEAVYTSPLKRAHCTGEEIAAQIGLSRDGVEPMQELIERDLGPFSGQLVKDKKEYFALAAGDHVEGMEPFADVQKRMEHAMELLAASRDIRQWRGIPWSGNSMCFWQGLRIMRSEPERQDSTMGQSM